MEIWQLVSQHRLHNDETKIVRVWQALVLGLVEACPLEDGQPFLHSWAIDGIGCKLGSHAEVCYLRRSTGDFIAREGWVGGSSFNSVRHQVAPSNQVKEPLIRMHIKLINASPPLSLTHEEHSGVRKKSPWSMWTESLLRRTGSLMRQGEEPLRWPLLRAGVKCPREAFSHSQA